MPYEDDGEDCEDHNCAALLARNLSRHPRQAGLSHVGLLLFHIEEGLVLKVFFSMSIPREARQNGLTAFWADLHPPLIISTWDLYFSMYMQASHSHDMLVACCSRCSRPVGDLSEESMTADGSLELLSLLGSCLT